MTMEDFLDRCQALVDDVRASCTAVDTTTRQDKSEQVVEFKVRVRFKKEPTPSTTSRTAKMRSFVTCKMCDGTGKFYTPDNGFVKPMCVPCGHCGGLGHYAEIE